MSEAEKKRRYDYKQNRKKWIYIQAFAILLVVVIALSMVLTYSNLNKTYYINYTESGSADYNVILKDNEFFDKEELESGKGYISAIVDKVSADFKYEMQMDAVKVKFDHTHYVEARVEIIDRYTKAVIYQPTELLVGEKTAQKDDDNVSITETVVVDFDKYNDMALEFIEAYALKNVESKLYITMYVDIEGSNSAFENNAENTYASSVVVPLCEPTMAIETSGSSNGAVEHVLACKRDVDPEIFKIIAIICGVIAAIGVGIVIAFIYLTRNEDINYEIKVKKLLNAYRSYIQIITNEFDTEGYQMLVLSTFNEMLGIRDTIQSPILMNENEDKTRTLFFIPTNTKILYVYEIKVEDYDEIYQEEQPEIIEEPVILEEVDQAELEEALETPDVELENIDYVEDDDEEAEEGIEVIGVVWPERSRRNKVYKYDPNGETVENGDIVLVPSRDAVKNKDIVRKATVAHGNHKVDPDTIHYPLKKIIGVVKRGLRSQLEK